MVSSYLHVRSTRSLHTYEDSLRLFSSEPGHRTVASEKTRYRLAPARLHSAEPVWSRGAATGTLGCYPSAMIPRVTQSPWIHKPTGTSAHCLTSPHTTQRADSAGAGPRSPPNPGHFPPRRVPRPPYLPPASWALQSAPARIGLVYF